MNPSISFEQINLTDTHCVKRSYTYNVIVVSNTGNKYVTYDNWVAYEATAKEAKRDILNRLSQLQAIDYILDDMVINDLHGNPLFILLEPAPKNNIHPVFLPILNSIFPQ